MKKDPRSWYQPLVAMPYEDEDGHEVHYVIHDAEFEPGEPETPNEPGCGPTITFGKVWVKGDFRETAVTVNDEIRELIEQYISDRAEQD